ncbi:MAG TPA: SRPBCC family protein [Anaerolineales bacterium]
MTNPTPDPATILQMRRTVPVSRERVFRAWTDPAQLKKWFAVADGFTTPIADVDLQIGGRYRLGMQPPGDAPILIVGGVYQEIVFPEKLVFTWRWESPDENEPETLVTLEFVERGGVTEVVLQHELFTSEALRDKHGDGWAGCLDHLERLFQT